MTTQEQPAAMPTTGAESMSNEQDTTPDYALPYGRRVPTSYDAEAAAALIGADAEYIAANGGKGFLSNGEVGALKGVIAVWADQFCPVAAGTGPERWQGFAPWDALRLEHAEYQAKFCEIGCACSQDVLSLVAELRRLNALAAGTQPPAADVPAGEQPAGPGGA